MSLPPDVTLSCEALRLSYDGKEVLHGIDLTSPRKQVTAFIGPSGCGKSTLLRCFNRLNDLVEGYEISGCIRLDGQQPNCANYQSVWVRPCPASRARHFERRRSSSTLLRSEPEVEKRQFL